MMENQGLGIPAFRRLSPTVITGGQPDESQLEKLAGRGVEVVINLGLIETYYALPDEQGVVEKLGLEYIHIPVDFEEPQKEDLEHFFSVMDEFGGKYCLVHCAANKRVSVFMALYRIIRSGWPVDDVMADVLAVWEPNPVWRLFFEEALS